MNPEVVVRIPVANDRVTTIRFPSPISSLEAAFIATELHPDARFLLSFKSGNEFFSVRALVPKATATMNVVWNRQTYVLDLFESDTPWLSVNFEQPATKTPSDRACPPSTSRLFGLLDTARAYPLLKQQQPAAVAGVECVRSQTTHNYSDYTIRIEEVLRFDAEDTLVFRIALTNHSAEPIWYLPQSLMVRAGQRVYFQSLTDANGVIPPRAEMHVYFTVTGSPDGSRNDLSPRNEFMVLLSRFPSSLTPSVHTPTSPPQSPQPTNAAPAQSPPTVAVPQVVPVGPASLVNASSNSPVRIPVLSVAPAVVVVTNAPVYYQAVRVSAPPAVSTPPKKSLAAFFKKLGL
ncbi:MAG TPA: hypothetical protein P5534_19390 [Candidatus Paceibacterota bacterium]|nr:hypothetical protein [Candidatus Paceibacterota bacterium]HRZ54713.1 hypothetical protein [Candidatus Paceibacterota bacterium]